MSHELLADLAASGDVVLFTGAGFSAGAQDRAGRALPRSVDLIAELWELLFKDGVPDGSTLPDLFEWRRGAVRWTWPPIWRTASP
jgi:hypothetical protein